MTCCEGDAIAIATYGTVHLKQEQYTVSTSVQYKHTKKTEGQVNSQSPKRSILLTEEHLHLTSHPHDHCWSQKTPGCERECHFCTWQIIQPLYSLLHCLMTGFLPYCVYCEIHSVEQCLAVKLKKQWDVQTYYKARRGCTDLWFTSSSISLVSSSAKAVSGRFTTQRRECNLHGQVHPLLRGSLTMMSLWRHRSSEMKARFAFVHV